MTATQDKQHGRVRASYIK